MHLAPDPMRHRVASGGDYKRGTTRDDSCGWAAIPVAISLAESLWVGAIPVAISIAELWRRRNRGGVGIVEVTVIVE